MPHPNKAKMDAAVQRWISEAKSQADAPTLLKRKAQWVAEQLAMLGRESRTTPAHLRGLTAPDLISAQAALEGAARTLVTA